MHKLQNKILTIIACVLWGSAFVGGKLGFGYTTPIHLSGIRFTLAGLLLIPLLFYQKIDWKAHLKEWRYLLLFGFIQSFVQYGLFFVGLNMVDASISAIIIGGGPLFIALMAHFTLPDDKLTFRKTFAIILGMVGIVFVSVTSGSRLSLNTVFYVGVIILILSNLVGATTNIIVAKNRTRVNPIVLTAAANLTGGIMLYIASIFLEDWTLQIYPTKFYLIWIWLAIIPAAGFSIWYSLLKDPEVKVSELNIWKFLTPVSGVILSWIILPNEEPNISSILGIIIISIALITLQWQPQKRKG